MTETTTHSNFNNERDILMRRTILVASLLASLLVGPASSATAHSDSVCGRGETESVAQALEYGFWHVLDGFTRFQSGGGVGQGTESCQYRLFWDDQTVTFKEGEPFYGGVIFIIGADELPRHDALAELSLLSEVVTLTDVDTGSVEDVELEYEQARYFTGSPLGRGLGQQRGFSTSLPAGTYESQWTLSYMGEVVDAATVTIEIVP